ncbi:peptidase M48 family protein [Mycena leptocephala]|nr:peptidase M48 family protein [Mycena leptocephala]
MSMVLRQFLRRSQLGLGKSFPTRAPKRPLLTERLDLSRVTAGLLLGGFYVSHLESVPETGRRRFMAVSKKQEELLRERALQETLLQFRGKILPLHHPITQQVRRITRRILTASNLDNSIADPWSASMDVAEAEIPRPPTMHPDKEWVVLVVDDRNFVNAFAAPGLVCVSTGIMPLAQNEDGLAAVIGHAPSSRHGLLLLLGVDLGLSSVLTNVMHSLPHSRALETEADIVGLKLMSRACYDPGAAPRFFETLTMVEKDNIPTFLRTHPPTAERVAHLKALLPESYNIYNSNPECSQLDEMRARGVLGKVRMDIRTGEMSGIP